MLKAFWQVRPDAKLAIGQVAPAGGKPRKDMTGVYSKLQAWRVFDEGPCRYDKVLLMDGSMCVASNVDEIFENEALQAAGQCAMFRTVSRPAHRAVFSSVCDVPDGYSPKAGTPCAGPAVQGDA